MVSPVKPIAEPLEVTIASGQSLSPAADLRGRILVGVIMPGAWTAANLTFQASSTASGTYVDVYGTDEAEMEITAAASRYLAIDPVHLLGANHLKVRSGTSAAAVAQGGDRVLTLMVAVPK